MVGKANVKCAKCGITSKEDTALTFHRAKVWAKYCFPNDNWTSDESLEKLYKQHKMLCGNHFDDSSFTSSDRKRLNKFAIPSEAQAILAQLRDEQHNPPQQSVLSQLPKFNYEMDVASTSQNNEVQVASSSQDRKVEVASTSQNSTSTAESTTQHHIHLESPNLTKESRRRKGILKELNVKTQMELSSKKQKLYNRCRKNISEIMRLRRKFKEMKKCKKSVLSALTNEDCVNDLIQCKLTSSFSLLLQSQLKNVPRKITGRRWTLDDKILALSIYKKSSQCYRLLKRLICLPSVSSLKGLLNKIPLICGINKQVIDTLKQITDNRIKNDNLCILAFDEMSIRKNLSYNVRLDQIDGYQDHAFQGRTSEIASHALTFMAIGFRKPWKQPIAFYFSGDCVTADRLAVLIKEVLRACFSAGLEVIGMVSDLDGVNIRAINSLGSSTDQPFINFEGHEIVTILDPRHLLKCFRNNFMKHDIAFTSDLQTEGKQIQGIAKWHHIEDFYKIDQLNPNFVFAPALTQQHLQPNGKQKMKVRLAAQVLSHSVAAGIFAKVGQNELPQEATGTATVISNMDKLFDAMNGDTPDRKRGKQFLTNMSSTSGHLDFFNKMKIFFRDMKFLGAKSKPPSQDGWLRTINAIEKLFSNLKKYNVNVLSVRRLNQDPLENCFGCIRSNCGCNPNPTSVQFIAALKTSLLTNLINNNKNRNCLDDDNKVLHNFKVFLNEGLEQKTQQIKEHVDEIQRSISDVEEFDIPQCSGEMQACAYVCGFIVKYLNVHCEQCKKLMLADPNTEVCHLFTSFKEYDDIKNSLKYIQPSFCKMVENAAIIINDYLRENSHKEKIKFNLLKICSNLNKNWLKGCEEHLEGNFKKIIDATITICLKRFCTVKNRGFLEEASKKSLIRKINILKNI
ncbi:unnamed protein product [Euphydryas editha]|uniref:THAP-type domain-containing protein n=1 Tax=Euphydryas editha TaxID=104508 RepID=A0AAU9TRW5_EUPED|nr:unnamed protein product [Euphydryas editha]